MSGVLNSKNFIPEKILNTKYKPCIIEVLDASRFIVGTYELVEPETELAKRFSEDDLLRINQRAGTLEVLNEFSVLEVHECNLGGVFDLAVNGVRLFVAHANGTLAIYSIDPITLLHKFATQSSMLTTVDFIHDDTETFIFCGGSTGILSMLAEQSGNLVEKSITDEPIWYLNTDLTLSGERFILCGSEDAKWRVIHFKTNDVVYTNSDAQAGVTSFNVLENSRELEDNVSIVCVGSYDGHLRIYNISSSQDDSSLQCRRLYSIEIGGGIWRIHSRLHGSKQLEIFGPAMYSGAFILNLQDFDSQRLKCLNLYDVDEKIPLEVEGTVQDQEVKLIYGAAKNKTSGVISSYNERTVHCFKIVNEQVE